MKDSMVLISPGVGEYEEKKSKFIAHIKNIDSEDDAVCYISELRKKYWDARHNCYAYILGENNEIQRFSDDGEPGGTAGKPILDVLAGSGLSNAIIVVTRYFGGVLLGTGGLVRAYGKASRDVLDKSIIEQKRNGKITEIDVSYELAGKIGHMAAKLGIHQMETDYGECVRIKYLVPEEEYERFIENLEQLSSGAIHPDSADAVRYALNSGKVIIC